MRFFINSILWVLLFGFFVLLDSCKKDDNNTIIIQGKITDANQNIAVANAEVTFWASRIQSGTYNPNYMALATVTTDASGNYNLQITKAKDAGFRITIEKPKYFGQTIDISVENLPAGTHSLNYSIYPEAYFKLNVKNTSFIDNTDFISYWFNNTQPTGLNCCNNIPINYTGQTYSNTIKCRTFGGQNMIVKWIVKKDNVSTPHESSVYCVPFDTTVFDLNY
ncbi:MAG: carboxypeptidase regulatory-like domain-containing protein [Bacteroidetes bacterium]|nr:carboxypeptidase regulatory-like domain-containing protein [Bacteroidota bacterium]